MFEDIAGLAPFRRSEAPAWLTDAALRRAVRSSELVAVRRGVLVGRRRLTVETHAAKHRLETEIAIAGLRGGSPPVACLGSAALSHNIARLGRPPARVRLYRERGGPWRDDGVAVLVCSLPPEHVEIVQGVPATTCARTAVDLARWVSFRSAVVVMDSALRRNCSPAQLEAVIARCSRWPGIRAARRAAQFADPRAESPLESISRVVFAEAGLPAPDLQRPIGDPQWPVGIVDFSWEEFGVIGEADGLMKYDASNDDDLSNPLRAEKLRQEALEALGYIVVRWTWDDIWRRPDWVVARLQRAMREGARRRTA